MTEDKMKKTMDFILEQQAQLTATVGQLSVKVARDAETATALLAIAEIQAAEIRDLTESTRDLRESTRALSDRQREADERQRKADERQRKADERQREADERGRQLDERLNALINIVERHISEGHGGNK